MSSLNIYGSERPHDDVYIIGDKAGLRALRDAINKALNDYMGTNEVFDSEGEAYDVIVVPSEPNKQYDFEELTPPYTDDAWDDAKQNYTEKGLVFPIKFIEQSVNGLIDDAAGRDDDDYEDEDDDDE